MLGHMTHSLTDALAGFAAGPVAPPPGPRHVCRLSALDWIAVGRAGAGEPVAGIVRDQGLSEGGAAQAHVFGAPALLPARAAALINGTTSHALDYDDTHFAHIGHPSVTVFPAALAVAETLGRSLPETLEAALIGMEASVRIGLWLGREHYQSGFHQTATAGCFGASLAAARLLRLDAGQMTHVLGLATSRAAGLKAQFGTMGKPYNAGQAAAAGVEVALLVARGLQANARALEGEFGYGATHRGAHGTDAALAGLGDTWLFESVSHKFHACCHGLHAALEAGRDLAIGADVREITVRTHPRWISVCNQRAPDTGLGAKFSYATVMAMQALGHDTGVLASFSDAICADPRLRDLRTRVTVVADDTLGEAQAVVRVRRGDGAEATARADLLAPMTPDARAARVRAKAAGLIGAALADDVWSLLGDAGAMAGDLGAALAG